jgi:hypothetical protein
MSKTYKLYLTFTLSPRKHFGVPRDKCKCGVCPYGSIIKEYVEYYSYGEEREVGEETFIMKDLDSVYNYFEAKYEDENFDPLGYIDESDYLREESLINPNDNDENEFSDGIGDFQLDIDEVELYNDETNELLETMFNK